VRNACRLVAADDDADPALFDLTGEAP
jgi:hypothetical protein